MGQYLSVGIASTIRVEKRKFETRTILDTLEESLDLKIFDMEETEKYIDLSIKEDVFTQNISELIKELSVFYSKQDKEFAQKVIEKIEGKTYHEMMEIAKDSWRTIGFQFLEGGFGNNDVSYIGEDIDASIDIIEFISNGKIIMECYNNMFQFLRNNIINNLKSPLKTAIFITIIG